MGFSLTTSGDKLALPTWNLRREWPHIICGELMGVVSDWGMGGVWGRCDWFGWDKLMTTCVPGVLDKMARGTAPTALRTRPTPRHLPRLRQQPPANVRNTHSS